MDHTSRVFGFAIDNRNFLMLPGA